MLNDTPTAAEMRVMRAEADRVRAQRLEADAAAFAAERPADDRLAATSQLDARSVTS